MKKTKDLKMGKGKTKNKVRYFIPEEYSHQDIEEMRIKLKNLNRSQLELLICVLGREIIRLEHQLKSNITSVPSLHQVFRQTKCNYGEADKSNKTPANSGKETSNKISGRKTKHHSQRILRSHRFFREKHNDKDPVHICMSKDMRVESSTCAEHGSLVINETNSVPIFSPDGQAAASVSAFNVKKTGSISNEALYEDSKTSNYRQSLSFVQSEQRDKNDCQQFDTVQTCHDMDMRHAESLDNSTGEASGSDNAKSEFIPQGIEQVCARNSNISDEASLEKILAKQGLLVVEDASKRKFDVFNLYNGDRIYHKEDEDKDRHIFKTGDADGAEREKTDCGAKFDKSLVLVQGVRDQTFMECPETERARTDKNKNWNCLDISKLQTGFIDNQNNDSDGCDENTSDKTQSPIEAEDFGKDQNTVIKNNSKVSIVKSQSCTSPGESSHTDHAFSTEESTIITQCKDSTLTFGCLVCKLRFQSHEKLKIHSNNVHQCDIYPCLICGKGFKNKGNLKIHLKKNHTRQRVLCSYCGKLVLKRRLKTHLEKVHEKPIYTCHICQKGFLKRECLEGHVNKHSNTKPFICEFCGRKYAYSTSLSSHRKNCVKAIVPSHLSHARSVEEKDTSYICEVCGMKFEGSSGLKDHHNAKHTSKSQVCHFCGKGFKWRPSYNRHVKKCRDRTEVERSRCRKLNSRNLTGKQYTCVCGKQYPYRQSFRRHQKTCSRKQDVEFTDYLGSTLELSAVLIQ